MSIFIITLMIFNLTDIFFKNQDALFNPEKRIAIDEGGTASSKTYSILQLLTDICYERTDPLLVSVVSESLPHLRMGCIRDFKNIMGSSFDENNWNASSCFYTFSKNVILEFFSADQPGKASGPRRDILYCNEVNNIPKVVVDNLSIRTRRFEFYDFNPVCQFWVHDLKGHKDVEWIHSTYLDAKHVLPASIVEKIEAKRLTDPNWWNVYGLGLIGNIEGLVHPIFSMVDSMPEGGITFFGLDFGFTNDPTALIYNKIIGNNLYSDLLIYQTGLTNQAICNTMQSIGVKKHYDEIFADSSEPKSIEEIRLNGWNIKPSPKGPDSLLAGIQLVNQFRQHWTKRSVDAIKEMRNYHYITDRDGKITNKPIDSNDHAIQARQYGVVGKVRSMQTQTTGMNLKI